MTRRQPRRPSRDRIVPGRRGGTYEPANVVIVCATCNNDRGHWSLPAFLAALRAEGDPRAGHVAAFILALATTKMPCE